MKRKVSGGSGRNYWTSDRILKPIPMGNYLGVQLSVNGKSKKFYVHRLVAYHFIGKPENDSMTVNHKDGDKQNNNASNLEWVTQKENNRHARNMGLCDMNGENNPMCKYPDELVEEIRQLYATGQYSQAALARKYGISHMQINRIVRYKLRGTTKGRLVESAKIRIHSGNKQSIS